MQKVLKKNKKKEMKASYLLFLFLATITFSCKQKTEEKDDCCKKKTATNTDDSLSSFSNGSIFDVESDWKTQNDVTVKMQSLKGKVSVLAMIFTHCQSACPRIVADLQRIESGLPENQLKNVQFILVSMDPSRDTPKRLKEFAADHKLDENRWTLLTSNENDVLEFANVLGMKFKKTEDGGFDHSNLITILDKNGVIKHQQIGLDQDPKASIDEIESLAGKN